MLDSGFKLLTRLSVYKVKVGFVVQQRLAACSSYIRWRQCTNWSVKYVSCCCWSVRQKWVNKTSCWFPGYEENGQSTWTCSNFEVDELQHQRLHWEPLLSAKNRTPFIFQMGVSEFEMNMKTSIHPALHERFRLVVVLSWCGGNFHLVLTEDWILSLTKLLYDCFQQDNVLCHKGQITSNRFFKHDSNIPPQSPDLSPTAHRWHVVKIQIMEVQQTNLQKLHDAIMSIWNKISNPLLGKVYLTKFCWVHLLIYSMVSIQVLNFSSKMKHL